MVLVSFDEINKQVLGVADIQTLLKSLWYIYKTGANSSAVGGPIHISKLQFKELSKRLISVEIVIEEEAQWL